MPKLIKVYSCFNCDKKHRDPSPLSNPNNYFCDLIVPEVKVPMDGNIHPQCTLEDLGKLLADEYQKGYDVGFNVDAIYGGSDS